MIGITCPDIDYDMSHTSIDVMMCLLLRKVYNVSHARIEVYDISQAQIEEYDASHLYIKLYDVSHFQLPVYNV